MNAQEQWKRSRKSQKQNFRAGRMEFSYAFRAKMYDLRREAALERIIARQKREISAQAMRWAELCDTVEAQAERIAELEAAYQHAWIEAWK